MSNHDQQRKSELKNLKDAILTRIEHERVKPEPRMLAVCRRSGLWALFAVSILLGAEAVAAILFSLSSVGWEYYEVTHVNLLTFTVAALPYLWLGLLGIITVLAYYNFRLTPGGYRYPLSLVLFVSLGGSFFGGLLLYGAGAGYVAEEFLDQTVPLYRSTAEFREAAWMQPRRGLYGGSVTGIEEDAGRLTILGLDGKTYVFNTRYDDDAFEVFEEGDRVQVIAVPTTTVANINGCAFFAWDKTDDNGFVSMLERRQEFTTSVAEHFNTVRNNPRLARRDPCRTLKLFDPAL